MGRPIKLTPEMQESLLELLKKGLLQSSACRLAGIAKSTFKRWIARGQREKSGIYRDFFNAVRAADSQIEHAMMSRLFELAMSGDPKAILDYLQRKFPDSWTAHPTLEPILSDETLSLSDQARAVGELMIRGEISPEQARTAASALREIAQVIDLDEIAAEVRRIALTQSYPTLGEHYDNRE